jgi:hypothetical protein
VDVNAVVAESSEAGDADVTEGAEAADVTDDAEDANAAEDANVTAENITAEADAAAE